MPKELPPSLKVGTGWIELEIISEPDVALTFRVTHLFYESENLATTLSTYSTSKQYP